MVGGVYNLQGNQLWVVELELPRHGPASVPTSSGWLDVVARIGNGQWWGWLPQHRVYVVDLGGSGRRGKLQVNTSR